MRALGTSAVHLEDTDESESVYAHPSRWLAHPPFREEGRPAWPSDPLGRARVVLAVHCCCCACVGQATPSSMLYAVYCVADRGLQERAIYQSCRVGGMHAWMVCSYHLLVTRTSGVVCHGGGSSLSNQQRHRTGCRGVALDSLQTCCSSTWQ